MRLSLAEALLTMLVGGTAGEASFGLKHDKNFSTVATATFL